MIAIESPFPQFFDKDGSPLDDGLLYFGVAYQNPETNPVTVYWDAAGTQPAAQPLRTLNGYVVRSGTPASVYVSSDYSLTVRSKRNRFIFTSPSNLHQLGLTTSPMYFGAVGNGVADDTAAVLQACNTGLMVDGLGKQYGINGTMQPTSFAGMFNARLKQLAPATASVRTLFLHNQANFVIRDVTVDLGSLYTGGSMADCGGIWIDGATSGFLLDNVWVTNGGPGNGIAVIGATKFSLRNCRATEFYHNVGAIDDVTQGLWFNNCTDFSVIGGVSQNITGVSTVRFSRGLTFGGCSYFSVVGVEADSMDQCFDVTGTLGNHDFVFSACVAKRGGTFGFKAANSAYDGKFVGCIASDCGLKSFVVSGQTEVANPLPRNIDFVGCKSRNAGSNGVWPAQAQGFRVESVPTIDASYPRGIRFIDCEATDDQVTTTMVTAFANDVAPIVPPAAGYNKNTVNTAVNCKAAWAGTPGVSFSGIHFPLVSATGTGTDSIPNSTWTSLSFGNDLENTAGMHNTVTSNDVFYVKEPGLYEVNAQASFIANNAGLRQLRATLNGVAQPKVAYVGAHPSLAAYLQLQTEIRVDSPGMTIKIEVFQTSGITLTSDRTQNFISIKKVG